MTTPPQPPSEPPSPEPASDRKKAIVRERLLRRFKVWLDDVIDLEEPPPGLATEIIEQLDVGDGSVHSTAPMAANDLYAICSAIVALTEQTKSQDKVFDQLQQNLPSVQDMVGSASSLLEQLNQERERQGQSFEQKTRDHLVQARRDIFKEVLDTVLDVRDRLVSGLDAARAQLASMIEPAPLPRRRWWQRRSKVVASVSDQTSREAIDALIKGYQLGLDRMDESLSRWHISPIDCQGQPFDPICMKAVDREDRSDVADGTVLAVLRPGYRWRDDLFRPTEVTIAKNSSPEGHPHE